MKQCSFRTRGYECPTTILPRPSQECADFVSVHPISSEEDNMTHLIQPRRRLLLAGAAAGAAGGLPAHSGARRGLPVASTSPSFAPGQPAVRLMRPCAPPSARWRPCSAAHRGGKPRRRGRHDRRQGAGQRQTGRLYHRPDPDLGHTFFAAGYAAGQSTQGLHLPGTHLRADFRHCGAPGRASRLSKMVDFARANPGRVTCTCENRRRHPCRHGRVRDGRRAVELNGIAYKGGAQALRGHPGRPGEHAGRSSSWARRMWRPASLRLLATLTRTAYPALPGHAHAEKTPVSMWWLMRPMASARPGVCRAR